MLAQITKRNQQNAKSSMGPKTEEGKARSSQNSLKHGMYAKLALLPNEDCEEYLAYTTAMIADLKPEGPLQHEFAQVVSDNFWRMRRFRITEANQMERIKLHAAGPGISRIAPTDLAWAAGQGWEDDCKGAHSIEALGRHEQRISNQTQKALSRLKDLQREARELALTQQAQPAKSGFVPQPVKTAPPAAAETLQNPDPNSVQPVEPIEMPLSTVQKTAA